MLDALVGEFLVLLGTFERIVWVGVIATLGIVITAAYILRLYQRTMTGPVAPGLEGMKDLKGREVVPLVAVGFLTILLGLYPAPILNVINPAVDRVMTVVGATDPAPTLAPSALNDTVVEEGTKQ